MQPPGSGIRSTGIRLYEIVLDNCIFRLDCHPIEGIPGNNAIAYFDIIANRANCIGTAAHSSSFDGKAPPSDANGSAYQFRGSAIGLRIGLRHIICDSAVFNLYLPAFIV